MSVDIIYKWYWDCPSCRTPITHDHPYPLVKVCCGICKHDHDMPEGASYITPDGHEEWKRWKMACRADRIMGPYNYTIRTYKS